MSEPKSQYIRGTARLPHPSRLVSTQSKQGLPSVDEGNKTLWLREGITSLLLFFMLAEWVYPLPTLLFISERTIIYLFIAAVGLFVVMDYLRINGWFMWPFKTWGCLYIVGYMSSHYSHPKWEWWIQYGRQIGRDIASVAYGQLPDVSLETRAFLFFLGWSLLISFIQMLMLERQHIFTFVLATVGYLFILQLFLEAKTSMGIVRTVFFGMLLTMLLHLPRLERKSGIRTSRSWPFLWMITGLLLVSLFAGVGWYASGGKAETKSSIDWTAWVDWDVPFLSDWARDHLSRAVQYSDLALSGYSLDDRRLGGAMRLDDTELFTAFTNRLTYWRGESKSIYDGKGWHVHPDEQLQLEFLPFANVDADLMEGQVVQDVQYAGPTVFPYETLFVGGQIEWIDSVRTFSGDFLGSEMVQWSPDTDNIYLSEGDIYSYRVVISMDKEPEVLSESMKERYLQLPDSLPTRVARLSRDIVGVTEDPYTQALLLQDYLRTEYTYSLDNAVIPGENEDFVDHFLFVNPYGYCDYFSTSMVVMLRSIGIPARWVKGFSPGEIDFAHIVLEPTGLTLDQAGHGGLTDQVGEDMYQVTVRNRDAHSWVEAYIPQMGWVTFDPTPGFGVEGITQGLLDGTADAHDPNASGTDIEGRNITGENRGYEAAVKVAMAFIKGAGTVGDGIYTLWGDLQRIWQMILLGLAAMMLVGWWLWRQRMAITLHLITMGYRRGYGGRNKLLRIFDHMWKRVFRRYGSKSSEQSLREYVATLPNVGPDEHLALENFVRLYENIRYDQEQYHWMSKKKIAEIWYSVASWARAND